MNWISTLESVEAVLSVYEGEARIVKANEIVRELAASIGLRRATQVVDIVLNES
jgi:hypothetical protein